VRLIHKEHVNSYLFLRCIIRFQNQYKIKIRKKLAFLNFVKFKTFLTLTVDPKKFMRLSDEYLFFSKAWGKLRQRLWKDGRFFYLKVLEITKNGRPHLHILCTRPFLDIKVIRKLWTKYGGGHIMRVCRADRFNGLSYLLKYVSKSIMTDSPPKGVALKEPSFALYGALLFASNKRMFSFNDVRSRKSILDRSPMSKCESALHLVRYDFSGSVTFQQFAGFCAEKKLAVSDFVSVDASFQDLRDFPNIFGVGGD